MVIRESLEPRTLALLQERGGWDAVTAEAVRAFLRMQGYGSWQLLEMTDSAAHLQPWLSELSDLGRVEALDAQTLWVLIDEASLRHHDAHERAYAAAKGGTEYPDDHLDAAAGAAGTLVSLWRRMANASASAAVKTACLVTAQTYVSEARTGRRQT